MQSATDRLKKIIWRKRIKYLVVSRKKCNFAIGSLKEGNYEHKETDKRRGAEKISGFFGKEKGFCRRVGKKYAGRVSEGNWAGGKIF